MRVRLRAGRPSFVGLRPASALASERARASSAKRDTRAEVVLRRLLYARGFRYRVNVSSLAGKPDVLFRSARVVVFVDGDFWHGRRFQARLKRLASGHNAPYWTAKIAANRARDRRTNRLLRQLGWTVVRVWETDIRRSPETVVARIAAVLRQRTARRG